MATIDGWIETYEDPHVPMKQCSVCKKPKSLDDFHLNASGKYGRSSQCKACALEKARAYRKANKASINEGARKYREANRDRVNETVRTLRAANPQYGWEGNYRVRARKFGFEIVLESFTREELVDRWGDACYLCGGGWDEVDHVVEVHLGGHHTLENCRPCCASCNREKHFDSRDRSFPRGVSEYYGGGRYVARFNGTHLGVFDTPEEAGAAAAAARSDYYEEKH